ncbi:MAG: hypothetical protein N3I86_15225 [Verrucomicrobiae bacterium]|nr:hypothetical protein [Verrucomicrobiae bacterium]
MGNKLEDYVLNLWHPRGRHKARQFAARLGITTANRHRLEEALLQAAAVSEEARWIGDNGFGQVFVLPFRLSTARGSAVVASVWMVRYGEDFPRLVSCYIVESNERRDSPA